MNAIFSNELDLEIGLGERIVQVIEHRIEWALKLQNLLENEPRTTTTADNFEQIAINALDVENVVFTVEKTRAKVVLAPTVPPPRSNLLYVRPTPTTLSILTCPTCNRTSFSSLQGLLNHARLAHDNPFASHDDCLLACAVPISPTSPTAIDALETGVEVRKGGSVGIGGLRSIFERALGVNGEGEKTVGTSLGHHADTPALAPFLGKRVVKRCINVYDEGDVDILDDAQDPKSSADRKWKMPYPHRSNARDDRYESCSQQESSTSEIIASASEPSQGVTPSTRFHITARVVVSDRSLLIPPAHRHKIAHTHKWLVSVDAPSYTIPLATFLKRMSFSVADSATEYDSTDLPIQLLSPPTMDTSPFAISGYASAPFLARITLEWAEAGTLGAQNLPMEIDYWVGLNTATNDTQVLDVELDRGTLFQPAPTGAIQRATLILSPPHSPTSFSEKGTDVLAASLSAQETVLTSLLPSVPLTLSDVPRGRPVPVVPYTFTTNRITLLGLPHGRRKAIEWSCTRTLHALYTSRLASSEFQDFPAMSVAEIYRWLDARGYFPRTASVITTPESNRGAALVGVSKTVTTKGMAFCAWCGGALSVGEMVHASCPARSGSRREGKLLLPVLDVYQVLRILPKTPDSTSESLARSPLSDNTLADTGARLSLSGDERARNRAFVFLCDPRLTLGIRRVVSPLCLSSFTRSAVEGERARTGSGRLDEVDRRVAPYAVLGLTTKRFLAVLVEMGTEEYRRDEERRRPLVERMPNREESGIRTGEKRILAPGHIIRALHRYHLGQGKLGEPGEEARARLFGAVAAVLGRPRVPVGFDGLHEYLESDGEEGLG